MKKLNKKIVFIVEKTYTGFSAYSSDHPIGTTGKSFSELLCNATEAYNLYLEDTGSEIDEKNIKLEIDLKQFFQHYRVINAKFLAKRIGMNESLLSQYVQGRKKPSPKQTRRILLGIHEIGRELSNLHLIV
ncbi:MAG: helix-turn-helix transcriptional regulator [Bacteroidales bacterium]|nr:helix-turn-helix transcriptional regulator [Bacteroidales bacterium]